MTTPIQTIEKKVIILYLVEFYFREKDEAETFRLPDKYKQLGMKFVERRQPLDKFMPLEDGETWAKKVSEESFQAKRVFVSINRAPSIGQYYRIAQL